MLRLSVMNGPQDGQESVTTGETMLISRDPAADLCLAHERALPAGGVTIGVDDGSIIVNDGGARRSVASGDLFQIGRTWLKAVIL